MQKNSIPIKELGDRAAQFLFASLLSSYPPSDFAISFKQFCDELRVDGFDGVIEQFKSCVEDNGFVLDLRSRYIELFDRGRSENSLYESEYGEGRSFAKGTDLVDISGFYKAFGFAYGQEGSIAEMPDHVAVELEFYALLLLKEASLREAGENEGVEVVVGAQQKFLESHLGRFVRVVSLRPLVASDPYFGLAFSCIADLVEKECLRQSVSPRSAEWSAGEGENEQMLCGTLNNPIENAPSLVQIR